MAHAQSIALTTNKYDEDDGVRQLIGGFFLVKVTYSARDAQVGREGCLYRGAVTDGDGSDVESSGEV
jgi:hypothetical protein